PGCGGGRPGTGAGAAALRGGASPGRSAGRARPDRRAGRPGRAVENGRDAGGSGAVHRTRIAVRRRPADPPGRVARRRLRAGVRAAPGGDADAGRHTGAGAVDQPRRGRRRGRDVFGGPAHRRRGGRGIDRGPAARPCLDRSARGAGSRAGRGAAPVARGCSLGTAERHPGGVRRLARLDGGTVSEERRSQGGLAQLAAGLIIGGVEVVLAVAFAALLFAGATPSRLGDGIGLYLVAAALTLGFLAWRAGDRGVVGSVQDAATAVLSILALSTATKAINIMGICQTASVSRCETPDVFLTVVAA